MKHKILGIIICSPLISSTITLALIPFNKEEQQTKNKFFYTTPVPLPISKRWIKPSGK